MDNKTIVLSF